MNAERSPIESEEFSFDPYPTLARLREEDPVHWVPGHRFWWISRHDDVKRLFEDPENATADRRAWEGYVAPPEGTFLAWTAANNFFSLPPKAHGRIRRFISAAFSPRTIARMEGQIREVVDKFAAPLHGRSGVVDLMAEFTDPIPNTVISRITGIPPLDDDEARFRTLAQATIQGFLSVTDPEAQSRGQAAFLELTDWVRELTRQRRAAPREDLVSDLVQARVDDHAAISDDEIVLMVSGLIGAGSETTAMAGVVSIITLLTHPEAMERLRRERDLIPKAISEILRFGFGGPGAIARYAVRDFELRGKWIRKGQMIMLSLGGANRDPAVYSDPDRFDIDRDPSDLLIFGHGSHYCAGSHLARQELRCMIDAMLDFLPSGAYPRLDLINVVPMGHMRRPTNLPIEFGQVTAAA